MAEVTAGESLGPESARPASAAATAAPYRPSVVGVLVDAVRRSAWHPVVLYVALAVLLVGAEIAVLAANGTSRLWCAYRHPDIADGVYPAVPRCRKERHVKQRRSLPP